MKANRKRGYRKQDFATRFWSKVDIAGPDECWMWLAWTYRRGYGGFDKSYAHRIAYGLTYGDIPEGLVVRHHCDNPPCVNPRHLAVGTQRDNIDDRERRGRGLKGKLGTSRQGAKNGNAKLTPEKVIKMRNAFYTGKKTRKELSNIYEVAYITVCHIIARRLWNY